MGQGLHGGQRVSSIPFGYDREGRPIRVRRRRRDYDLVDTLLYPISDGPGIALLVFMPPPLTLMSLPVFDLFIEISTKNVLNPAYLFLLPFGLPLIGSFACVMGYVCIFFGRVLAAGAFGEDDQPRWPDWDLHEIAEGVGRWLWAALMGFALGGFPAMVFWIHCGDVDAVDWFLFGDLAAVGMAYALMALAASLLHENVAAANPLAVVVAIRRVGWDYVAPCVLAILGVVSIGAAWRYVLFHSPDLMVGMVGIWACWAWTLYGAMVVFRSLGLTYHKHFDALGWFNRPPRWGT